MSDTKPESSAQFPPRVLVAIPLRGELTKPTPWIVSTRAFTPGDRPHTTDEYLSLEEHTVLIEAERTRCEGELIVGGKARNDQLHAWLEAERAKVLRLSISLASVLPLASSYRRLKLGFDTEEIIEAHKLLAELKR